MRAFSYWRKTSASLFMVAGQHVYCSFPCCAKIGIEGMGTDPWSQPIANETVSTAIHRGWQAGSINFSILLL
jgi:hypothetical protein